jgi:exonuclease VII small subunit
MKRKPSNFSRRYQEALRTHLKKGRLASLQQARALGKQAMASGMQTLDLARLHEQTLVKDVLPKCAASRRAALIRRAGIFFATAITPLENTYVTTREATARLKEIVETLSQRTVQLAASNLELSMEITLRKAVEQALKKSEHHYSQLLEQSDSLQDQLRHLSRQILSAQEE